MPRPGKPLVVVADDDPTVLKVMDQHLQGWDCEVAVAADKGQLLGCLARATPDLLLLDLRFGEHDGVELLPQLVREYPDLPIVLLTAHGSIDNAVTAIKLGAYDYLTKPPDLDRLRVILAHVREKQGLHEKIKRLEQLVEPTAAARLWGESAPMRRVRELIATVGPTDATVLILGESGTGKELIARALHEQSLRLQKPFVPVNMAALPRELAESTLFGHEKGAFTGADQPQVGCCEAADGGTLFLDEIGEMDLGLQTKLLRFLQERTVQRVGASKANLVDARVLAATNRDLAADVRAGRFREDLYYRLNVVPLTAPSLRERPEDVPLLAGRFLRRFALKYGKEATGFTEEALAALGRCDWPGNVRQLENLVERLVILSTSPVIDVTALPPEVRNPGSPPPSAAPDADPAAAPRTMDELERLALIDALHRTRGNVRDAARLLAVGQATVYRKIKRYGIVLEDRGRAPA